MAKLLESECGLAWETKTCEDPATRGLYTFLSFFWKSPNKYSHWRSENNFLLPSKGGKSNHFEIFREHPVLLNKGLHKMKTVLPKSNPLMFYHSLRNIGKQKNPAPSSLPVSLKKEKSTPAKAKKLKTRLSPGHRLTDRLITNHRIIEYFPSPQPPHTSATLLYNKTVSERAPTLRPYLRSP